MNERIEKLIGQIQKLNRLKETITDNRLYRYFQGMIDRLEEEL